MPRPAHWRTIWIAGWPTSRSRPGVSPWHFGRSDGPGEPNNGNSRGAAVLVALAGTAAVLAVQTRANANLHFANTELAAANAKVTLANSELAASNLREQARFALAQEAIRIFHTGVSEDLLLKQKEFGTLRTKLLRGAQEFYRRLEGMLGDQTDRDSRLALARAYYEVGELTRELDSKKDALAMHQRALAMLDELARQAPADAELQGEVERSCAAVAFVLSSLGQMADALAASGRARRSLRTWSRLTPGISSADASWRGLTKFMERFFAATLD